MRARGLVSALSHGSGPTALNIALRFRMSAAPLADPVAAPILGQHSAAVLRDLLGYDASQIAALGELGVIRDQNAVRQNEGDPRHESDRPLVKHEKAQVRKFDGDVSTAGGDLAEIWESVRGAIRFPRRRSRCHRPWRLQLL